LVWDLNFGDDQLREMGPAWTTDYLKDGERLHLGSVEDFRFLVVEAPAIAGGGCTRVEWVKAQPVLATGSVDQHGVV
jgi:hypothetical protein